MRHLVVSVPADVVDIVLFDAPIDPEMPKPFDAEYVTQQAWDRWYELDEELADAWFWNCDIENPTPPFTWEVR